jgi:hypothetical protein
MQKALVQLKKTKGMQHEYYPILLENIASLHLRLGNRELAKTELDSAEAFYNSEKKKNTEAYAPLQDIQHAQTTPKNQGCLSCCRQPKCREFHSPNPWP